MRIRELEARDREPVVAIYNHAILNTVATFDLETTSVEGRSEWFARFGDENPMIVAEDEEGRLLGYAYWLPYRARPAYAQTKELSVYTHPEGRGKGVGSALYAALLERARAAGLHALIGVIAGENPASEALHRRFGFRHVGDLREVGRKFDAWVDTHYYQLVL